MRDEPGGIPYDQLTGRQKAWRFIRRNPTMVAGGLLLLLMVLLAVFAPYLWTVNPIEMQPAERLRAPSGVHWFGTDMYGRDSFSRVVYGSRVSLFVGLVVGVGSFALFAWLVKLPELGEIGDMMRSVVRRFRGQPTA